MQFLLRPVQYFDVPPTVQFEELTDSNNLHEQALTTTQLFN